MTTFEYPRALVFKAQGHFGFRVMQCGLLRDYTVVPRKWFAFRCSV